MERRRSESHSSPEKYSARRMHKPVNFFCRAPSAQKVSLVGDFNGWDPHAHLMQQGPDGSWHLQVPLHHGHHHYLFLVDGKAELDPGAQGIARNAENQRVSLMSVS